KYVKTLKKELETLKEEKDVVDGKLARLHKSSKDLKDIIESQRPTTNKAEFLKAAERPTTDRVETVKKPAVRYAEMYRRTSKRRRVHRETTRSQNHAYKSPSHRSYGAPM
nr:hypothetical protein [Tanacetum cinerariifolium]